MGTDRRRFIATALAAPLASVPMTAVAQPAKVVLGTATPGGGFPAYGAALVAALRTVDPELEIEARNTQAARRTSRCWSGASSISGWSRARCSMWRWQASAARLPA